MGVFYSFDFISMNYKELKINYEKWIKRHEMNGGGLSRSNSSNRVEGTNKSIPFYVLTNATMSGVTSFELANKKE